jgi:ankyrin repeat protein
LLLDRGADVCIREFPNNATPLHFAAVAADIEIVKMLVEADAAVVALLEAAGARLDFLTAVNLGRYAAAEAMLRADPSRIGADGRDTIALHLAVSRKNVEAIRRLIARGVDVNAKRLMWDCNHTALHMTIENRAIDIARILLDAGADPNIKDDKYDATALGWATFFGREDFAQLVRERGGS